MNALFRTLKVDLRRSLLSGSFVLTAALLFFMQLLEFFPQYVFQGATLHCWQYELALAHHEGIPSMILFLGTICYSWSYCLDNDSGFFVQAVRRVGVGVYCTGKIISVAISAFLAGILADGLFTILLVLLPLENTVPDFMSQFSTYMALAHSGKTGLFLLLRYVHTGMVCAMVASMSLATSTLVKNAYVIIFLPYLLYELFNLITTVWGLPGKEISLVIFGHRYGDQVKSFWYMFCVMISLICVFGLLFYGRVKKRR